MRKRLSLRGRRCCIFHRTVPTSIRLKKESVHSNILLILFCSIFKAFVVVIACQILKEISTICLHIETTFVFLVNLPK